MIPLGKLWPASVLLQQMCGLLPWQRDRSFHSKCCKQIHSLLESWLWIHSTQVKICAEMSYYEHFCHVLQLPTSQLQNILILYRCHQFRRIYKAKFIELQFCSVFAKFRKYVNVLFLLKAGAENTHWSTCACVYNYFCTLLFQIAVRISKLVCICLVLLKFP